MAVWIAARALARAAYPKTHHNQGISLPKPPIGLCPGVLFPSKSFPLNHLGAAKNRRTAYNFCSRKCWFSVYSCASPDDLKAGQV